MKRHLAHLALLLGSLVCLPSVSGADDSAPALAEDETVWVFFQFNVPASGDVIDFSFYGRIPYAEFRDILNGDRTEGFICLHDTRYWQGDTVYAYEDDVDTGLLVFRVEHIQRMILLKADPLLKNQPENEPTAIGEKV